MATPFLPVHLSIDSSELMAKLEEVLHRINQLEIHMSKELDDLKAAVTQTTAVEQSAITLIQGLAVQLNDIKNDPAAIAALATDLTTQAAALSAAITANTPAAP